MLAGLPAARGSTNFWLQGRGGRAAGRRAASSLLEARLDQVCAPASLGSMMASGQVRSSACLTRMWHNA